jgi:hypothetical protein
MLFIHNHVSQGIGLFYERRIEMRRRVYRDGHRRGVCNGAGSIVVFRKIKHCRADFFGDFTGTF